MDRPADGLFEATGVASFLVSSTNRRTVRQYAAATAASCGLAVRSSLLFEDVSAQRECVEASAFVSHRRIEAVGKNSSTLESSGFCGGMPDLPPQKKSPTTSPRAPATTPALESNGRGMIMALFQVVCMHV